MRELSVLELKHVSGGDKWCTENSSGAIPNNSASYYITGESGIWGEFASNQSVRDIQDQASRFLAEVGLGISRVKSDCANGAEVGGLFGGAAGLVLGGAAGAVGGAVGGGIIGCTLNVGVGILRDLGPGGP
jgi:hypothetical protein